MIRQIRASDIPPGRPAIEGKIYAVRVVQFTQGDTISFNDPKSPITIFAPGATYRRRTGWERIYLFAAASSVIECVTEVQDAADFDAANASLAGQQGIVASGSPASGNPVQVAGVDSGLIVRELLTGLRGELDVTAEPIGRRSYKVSFEVAQPSTDGPILAFETSALLRTFLRRMRVTGTEISATAATIIHLLLQRTTAASTGGALRTPNKDDPGDTPFGGLFRVSAPGTTPAAGSQALALADAVFDCPAAANVVRQSLVQDLQFDGGRQKGLLIPAGVANGLALFGVGTGLGAAGRFTIDMWLSEE